MEVRAGPSITSSDPEERKLARRLRIERREKAIAWAKLGKNDEEEEVVIAKTPVELQVEKSNKTLNYLLKEGDAYVRNIRRAADIRLQERNKINDVTKQRIETEFEAQSKEAEEKFDEIISKWAGLTILNDPLQIHEAILHQKSQCVGLLQKKDEFIKKLKLELMEVDKNFDKDVAKQKDDMEILTHRINLQIKYLKTAFEKQFHTIQNVIQSEQQKFFKMRNDLWNDLYKKYMDKEYENSEFIIEQRNEMRHLLIETRDNFAEELRQTNIRLDIDVHVSRDELERIKAIVKNNLEKWEYNFWILESRRNENVFIKAEQKKKITYLQGKIIGLQKNLRDFYNQMAKKIQRHEESLKKLKHDILQIEDKADHFASSNEILFNQIWDLNRHSVLDLLDQIYQIDKTLHQQQLGLPWNEPNIKDIDKQLMPSYQHALTIIHNVNQQKKSTKNVHKNNGSYASQSQKKENEPSSLTESITDFNPTYRKLVRHLMGLISDKSGFLTESRLQSILKGFEDKDRNLIKVWNVFDSLDINGIDEIDALITYFLPYCFCPVCVDSGGVPLEQEHRLSSLFTQSVAGKSEMTQGLSMFLVHLQNAFEGIQQPNAVIDDVLFELIDSSINIPQDQPSVTGTISEDMLNIVHTEMEKEKKSKKKHVSADEKFLCINNHPLVISSVYIMVALKDYVTSYLEHSKEFPTNEERLRRHRFTISRLLDNKDIKMIWSMLKDGFSKDQSRIWNGLEEGVKKYYDILVHRKAISEDVLKLRRENHKLKKLLNIYMANSKVMPRICGVRSIV